MMGIVLVSHLEEISIGIQKLLWEFNKDVPITYAKTNGAVGTTFTAVEYAVSTNSADTILLFYDLGSSKINAQLVQDVVSTKKIEIMNNAMIEGAILAVNLIDSNKNFKDIIFDLKSEELASKS